MGNNSDADRLLEGAYAIKSAEDNLDYYREFASIYDEQFANAMGYVYPRMLASVYQQHAHSDDLPIMDVGCGTGLVAHALNQHSVLDNMTIDGIDISPEMLDVAKSKGVYRDLYQKDLTATDSAPIPENYGAVVSAGTFTFGHLGPEVLPTLLAMGRSNTLYCIGVNSEHYEQQGFARVLDSMIQRSLISQPVVVTKQIYEIVENSTHANDTATVLVYRQT